MKTTRIAVLLLSCQLVGCPPLAHSAEIHQDLTPYNFQSGAGVPISRTVDIPPGSNGGQPEGNESGSGDEPTPGGQFQGLINLGGTVGLPLSAWLAVSNSATLNAGETALSGALAEQMKLPVAKSENDVLMVMRRVQIGAPFLNRPVAFLFGSVITPPKTDEDGVLLSEEDQDGYWLPEPYDVNGDDHADAPYYWSPNARQVFAIQAGPVVITWRKAVAADDTDYVNVLGAQLSSPIPGYESAGALTRRLYTVRQIVSGSAVKTPRKIYWTEAGFNDKGKVIDVPAARVGAVKVVHNNNFPETVAEADIYGKDDGTSPFFGGPNQDRTLFYDATDKGIHAYNIEGRVFLELLGDLRPDGQSRQHLGFEIVDVFREPTPTTVSVDLGEQIIPPPPASVENLVPEPLFSLNSFAYRHAEAGSGDVAYYATRPTSNLNDYSVHWMEAGEQGLMWPSAFARYQLSWPADISRYSHYVRPFADSDEEARKTAVAISPQIVPTIEYQDPLDKPRGNFTPEFKFYTWLDETHPAHRSLLRFASEGNVAFERVFSWLDTSLKGLDFTNSVATNLTTIADYQGDHADYLVDEVSYQTDYDNHLGDYADRLAAVIPSVEGDWRLHVIDETGTNVGSISSWNLTLVTTNAVNAKLATNEFTSSEGITFSSNFPPAQLVYHATNAVADIIDLPIALQVKFHGFGHTHPDDLNIFLVAPNGRTCVLMSDAGGGTGFEVADLVFADAAAPIPDESEIMPGVYQPADYEAMESLPSGVSGPIVASLSELLDLSPLALVKLDAPVPPGLLDSWPLGFNAPRVVNQIVRVGQRITDPGGAGEAPDDYLAGYINQDAGTSFNPDAYVDPFTAGFEAANLGAVIPVNAIPGANQLEVWWFRPNSGLAGPNVGNEALGFQATHWPSVIGRYTIEWPTNASEIVLAGNAGSGALPSLQAAGSIYYQNDPVEPGYNPNEEHALMLGGQAYALRDDLNLSDPVAPARLSPPNATYSSEPYVLLEYTEADGRPAVRPFRVQREKLETDEFNYPVVAGKTIQPPMPLPLMPKPLAPKITGEAPRSLNTEVYFRTVTQSRDYTVLTLDDVPRFLPYFRELALQSPNRSTTEWFFPVAISGTQLFGFHSYTRPALVHETDHSVRRDDPEFQYWDPYGGFTWKIAVVLEVTYRYSGSSSGLDTSHQIIGFDRLNERYVALEEPDSVIDNLGEKKVTLTYEFVSYQSKVFPGAPQDWRYEWLEHSATNLHEAMSGVTTLVAPSHPTPISPAASTETGTFSSIFARFADWLSRDHGADGETDLLAGWELKTDPAPPSGDESQNSFVVQDRKGDLWVYRGPHDEQETNTFMAMQFYYATQPGFYFPEIGPVEQPSLGTITPYLRSRGPDDRWIGDPVKAETNALPIHYVPAWSTNPVPTLFSGETLTVPKRDLPAVRGQSSLQVVYQQSLAAAVPQPAVVLHDPTRERSFMLDPSDPDALHRLPDSVKQEASRGRIYFPLLPPHLSERFFFDPARGANGALVFKGEFVDETLGEDYLHLSVIGDADLNALIGLCSTGDPRRDRWANAITRLNTTLETFVEHPKQPGTYVPGQVSTIGPQIVAAIDDDDIAVDSYALSAAGPGVGYVSLIAGNGRAFTPEGDPVSVLVLKVATNLYTGELKVIPSPNPLSELLTFQHTADLAAKTTEFEYEWKIAPPVDGLPPETDATMSRYQPLIAAPDTPRYTLGGAGIQALVDNYMVMRYRPTNPSHPLFVAKNPDDSWPEEGWSEWTEPALAEGWIKRVLAGINPFNQRVNDLFNNQVNTDVSILTQAGHRWEGDVALNLDSINDYGLIEIYETVLRRGKMLSIDSGINFGPANDALLLAVGYLNDLYMMEGNEAWADAANPTIGIGTKDSTYGEIATALFSFKGQVPTVLEEELALLRGRDDFLLPGVGVAPVYNRLVWNYTRGIDSGEVIYALNYNIQEDPNKEPDGIINAADAARMFPQGHGDAYGHYLTALKGYYSLLMNSQFDWVPRIEAVNVLGAPVSVDYQDERKFAAAAAATARAGRQIFDLTWREDYGQVDEDGWGNFGATRANAQRTYDSDGETKQTKRHWGMDHWASRTGEGAYLNWVVGNAILPETDPDPTHEGIQKVDRTTVPELVEIASLAEGLQTAMENAESGLSPLGLPQNALAFDIDPNFLEVGSGIQGKQHFDQVYDRALAALNNALAAFDDAKDVTRLMRSEQDSLVDLQDEVARQERAYRHALIEIYGTPYPDDIGPGKTWTTGYDGPDTMHYMYVETPEYQFPSLWNYPGSDGEFTEFKVDITDFPSDWGETYDHQSLDVVKNTDKDYDEGEHYISFHLGPHGFFDKPRNWTGRRASPGRVQEAVSRQIAAHYKLRQALYDQLATKASLDRLIGLFELELAEHEEKRRLERLLLAGEETYGWIKLATDIGNAIFDSIGEDIKEGTGISSEAIPRSALIGTASGGDLTSPARAALRAAGYTFKKTLDVRKLVSIVYERTYETILATSRRWTEFDGLAPLDRNAQVRASLTELGNMMEGMQAKLWTINEALREYEDAQANYRAVLAEGERIQEEREVFRKRSAALTQGFRTRDAAFRIFRNEKLERYKTLFDLAARYTLLAANVYDYETGLLNTPEGRAFVNRIINARALGVVRDGEPQFAGSNTGDPGLSSVLAEMKADWEVLRGRLGFNNPDSYGTTVSLRTEKHRILPDAASDVNWQDVMQQARMDNILEDPDVRRYCLQIGGTAGLPVPGLVIDFSTTIADGLNLFGNQLAAGDHAYSPSSFATKIFAAGVALEGYKGMDDPSANDGAGDPDLSFLDPDAMSATPYIYLIPVGVDSMRSPPLGDADEIRSWTVSDVAIPMPFNIGASAFSENLPLWQSSDWLSEPMFGVRKHQAFRPVSTASVFHEDLAGSQIAGSQFTNNRLIGRSVWNSRWKLIIPGKTLLADPNEGLERFMRSVKDIKLHFVTYSFSGN